MVTLFIVKSYISITTNAFFLGGGGAGTSKLVSKKRFAIAVRLLFKADMKNIYHQRRLRYRKFAVMSRLALVGREATTAKPL